MGHTPYRYRIENGIAVVDEHAAEQVQALYQSYLSFSVMPHFSTNPISVLE